MKNIIKDTLILFAITLVAGLGLGLVYNVTANSRAMQEYSYAGAWKFR